MALAITAPAGSETVPVIVPRSVCANAVNVTVKRLRTSKRIRTALSLLQAMRNFHGIPGLCPKRFKAQTKWECRYSIRAGFRGQGPRMVDLVDRTSMVDFVD